MFSVVLLAGSFDSPAQSPPVIAKIAVLSPFSPRDSQRWHQALEGSLRELGWTEGKNATFIYRYANGRNGELPKLADELIRLKPNVIVTSVTNDTLVAKNATATIPIVMAASGDPVATGIVTNLARPGGNVTGLSQMNPELMGKRLELLKQIVPRLDHVAALWNPEDPISIVGLRELKAAAEKLGIDVQPYEARDRDSLDRALEASLRTRAGALVVLPNPVFVANLKRIADFAAKGRLASIFHVSEFAEVGGLLAYGPDRVDLFRRAGVYVDKVLRGARPGDLPVEQPTKFELVLNMRTARLLGLSIPPSVRVLVDRLVE